LLKLGDNRFKCAMARAVARRQRFVEDRDGAIWIPWASAGRPVDW
jgi:hypothetical protein